MIKNRISKDADTIEQNHQGDIIAEQVIANDQNFKARNQSNQEKTAQNDVELPKNSKY